ncbi:MAG: 2OG-Fe(II) oxygenase [Rhodospirillales bacterium]
MRVEQPYQVWPGFFPASFCDDVIALGEALKLTPGTVTHDPHGKARASEVAWIGDTEEHAWIYGPVADLIAVTNRKFWGWRMAGRETIQYTRYGENQFYGWHMDARKKPYAEGERWGGLVRKISVSINLSHPDDYQGGAFEIEQTTPTPDRPERRITALADLWPQGSAVVFPAHLHHRVLPVTRGMRRSLVGWFLGPPFE